ncbi:hypothetical protein B0T19DRAFT_439483 [Cercophora scortea]|uniref:DUF7702 domain-containing protein n=1 Tax=Cercophora scortea TaxID=314031 RepID=A0AAE0IX27_9PEZI|nr:hypothetical protein B0T19DRAFT_439483 [Cercophora scortea]
MDSLPTAELAIYATLSLAVIYVFVRHWPTDPLGWAYLFAFCTLRIVGGAMANGGSGSSSASIISSIGLSPLLLATSGILHESRVYRNPNLNTAFEWTLVGVFHVLVATGVALIGAGASSLQGSQPKASDLNLVDVGIALLTTSWALLVIWGSVSLLPSQHSNLAHRHWAGTTLLYSVLVSLVFIGIRVIYALVALSTRQANLNPVTGSIVIRVLLSFLPELIATLVFLAAGIRTQAVGRKHSRQVKETSERKRSHRRSRRDGLSYG